MLVIKGKPRFYVDVDDTLVSWKYYQNAKDCPSGDAVEFIDPDTGETMFLSVIKESIDQIKSHYIRGHDVIVWSASSGEWAEEVCKRLGIEKYVTLAIGKPDWYLDDLPAGEFMPPHTWYKPKDDE